MIDLMNVLADNEFLPHGLCLQWNTNLLLLHVISDSLTALAYYSIPFSLVYFVRRRRDVEFSFVFYCFAIFIVACGTTHLFDVWTIWVPRYYSDGIVRAITGISSVTTAALVWYIMPQLLTIPGRSQLEDKNRELSAQIEQRIKAEQRAINLANTLEERVEQRTKELQQALQEKDLFVRETHHRVRNNLQVISSLLQLQVLATSNSDTFAALRTILGRIESMRLVHDELYKSDLVNLPLRDYVEKLSEHVARSRGCSIAIEVTGESEIGIGINEAVPVGLIVNEVITNACLHAFPKDHPDPAIGITISRLNEEEGTISIRDNGIGFDLASIGLSSRTIGMKLVEGLVKQIDGDAVFSVEDGVRFLLTVRISRIEPQRHPIGDR